jgi:cell wall assembly regulator SMI1
MHFEAELNSLASQLEVKEFGMGASVDDILATESRLQVKFSDSFRRFLRRFGWAVLQHLEIFGLGPDVPRHLNLVDAAIRERAVMQPPIPHFLIPVMNDGAGNHYCLDTRETVKDENPIVFWCHEEGAGQIPQKVANSFAEWLISQIKELIQP